MLCGYVSLPAERGLTGTQQILQGKPSAQHHLRDHRSSAPEASQTSPADDERTRMLAGVAEIETAVAAMVAVIDGIDGDADARRGPP
jgi:hypothetical protein